METQVFDTKPLLRPRQAEEAKSELKAIEAKLRSDKTEDKADLQRQFMRMNKTVNDQLPKLPVDGEEEGRMVARSKHLLSEIVPAMCSQEEMRKAPPGSVDKYQKGENSKAIKNKILEWKNLELRLKPGEEEAANLERHRPVGSTLNMDNAYIPGKQIYIPEGVGRTVTFNDEQMAALRAISPQIAEMLGILPNQARAEVKQALTGGIGLAEPSVASEPSAASIAGKKGSLKREAMRAKAKKRPPMSDAQKAQIKAGRDAYWAKKKAA